MSYLSDKAINKMNCFVNDNIDELTNFRGMSTDIALFFVGLIPKFFDLHRSFKNMLINRNESLVWRVLDLIFFGGLSLLFYCALSVASLAFSVFMLPVAVVVDGLPSLFSKNYRNQAKFARMIRKINSILQRESQYSNYDYAITKTQKMIASICYSLNPLDDQKIERLIQKAQKLKNRIYKTEKCVLKKSSVTFDDNYPQKSIDKRPKQVMQTEQSRELYKNICSQEDEFDL